MAPQVPDKSFDDQQPTTPDEAGDRCPFCRIAHLYAPYDPTAPPPATSPALSPDLPTTTSAAAAGGAAPAPAPAPETYVVLSTPTVMAFLDIMPLARGHLLLCPRRHAPKLTGTTPAEARELGYYLRVLSAALGRATGVGDWNVVQNNGAAAAQVVPHMHYHVIPRPEIRAQGRWSERFTMFGRGQRSDLDPEDGEALAELVRRHVVGVLAEEREEEGERGEKERGGLPKGRL